MSQQTKKSSGRNEKKRQAQNRSSNKYTNTQQWVQIVIAIITTTGIIIAAIIGILPRLMEIKKGLPTPIFIVLTSSPSTPENSNLQGLPTNIPTISETPALGELIFEDNFENNNNLWPTGKDPNNDEVYLDNGEYHIIGYPNGSGMWYGVKNEISFGNFYLETNIQRVQDDQVSTDFGIYFRNSNSINYIFVIDPGKQTYALLRVDLATDGYAELIPWVYSPKILTGLTPNTLGLLCSGDIITIYINGYRVDSVEDNNSLAGTIGFVGGRAEHVAIDYLRIWALK